MKTIWIAREANGNTDNCRVFFTRQEAEDAAHGYYAHMTERERRENTVSLESWPVDVSNDDPRTAEELWSDLLYDGDESLYGDPATWEEITREY